MKRIGLKIWKGLVSLQAWFLLIGGIFVTVLVFVEVMLRYVFEAPLFGVEELIVFICMWLYFIGASYGAYEHSHIKADVAYLWFKTPRSRALLRTTTSFITVALVIVMVKWSLPYFIWGITKGETSQTLLLPMVIPQSAIFFSAILMLLYFTVELTDCIYESLGKSPPSKQWYR